MPLPPLPDFLRPKPPQRPPSGPGDDNQAVQAARTRARQRLVGALVLLVVGVITFPLLFETQPRPLAVDTPIKLAQRDTGTVRPLSPPAERTVAPDPVLPVDAGVEAPAAGGPGADSAGVAPPPSLPVVAAASSPPRPASPASQPAMKPGSQPEPKPEPRPEPRPEPAPATLPPPPAAPTAAPTAAQPPPSAAAASAVTGRFVVQVGAFSDPRTLREARQKVERLGLKTYTQVIGSGSGQRTRVRIGPFETRTEAEAAARTIKGGGLPAVILAL